MCGIAGVCREPGRAAGVGAVKAALDALKHRGPDDIGLEQRVVAGREVVLGQTRLAVIDLTSGGHQPMVSSDGRHLLVFNGEIYNYRELRRELEAAGRTFATRSDTEVLLVAWQHWGRDCLPRLRGMFAFALLDIAQGTLTCVRDPFGIKPFHYTRAGGGFSFASELPALVDLVSRPFELNHRQVYRYLHLGFYDESAETFVAGIEKLRPGSLLVFDIETGRLSDQERWWWPSVEERRDLTFDQAADQLRELVLDSVRLHLRSDVPLGTALSGGIDSSVIVGAMRHVAPDAEVHTFSYVARSSPVNEEPWVDLMNAHVGAVPHKVVATSAELLRDLDDVIRAQGEPFGSTSIYAQYRVFRAAHDAGVTVTLDGQGADELLAGYAGYPGYRVRSLLSQGRLADVVRFACGWSAEPGRTPAALAAATAAQVVPRRSRDRVRLVTARTRVMTRPEDLDLRTTGQLVGDPPRGRHLATVLRDGLVDRGLEALLRHADRNSMAFSIESRVPFLHVDVAEFLLTLPEDYLVSEQGQTKRVLRAAMRGVVPDAILDRRDKIGFETPQGSWMQTLGLDLDAWLEGVQDYPYVDVDALRPRVTDWLAGRRSPLDEDVVWRLLNFSRWRELMGPRLAQ
ncbi:asparagine synthase (glutamine-hydrolyzing) [Pedococcus sp. 2YAF34]|uniref:asparagine synthase (glutamine-hydrolyzing) n=1 Tax=Pedococcus sp. 2YAF34 TaxID=3233032 RepID=UPI003F99F315